MIAFGNNGLDLREVFNAQNTLMTRYVSENQFTARFAYSECSGTSSIMHIYDYILRGYQGVVCLYRMPSENWTKQPDAAAAGWHSVHAVRRLRRTDPNRTELAN